MATVQRLKAGPPNIPEIDDYNWDDWTFNASSALDSIIWTLKDYKPSEGNYYTWARLGLIYPYNKLFNEKDSVSFNDPI
jgi:hypothetical protein